MQKLIDAGRTGIYAQFLFIAAKIYLLALIEDLKEIFIVTATGEIQAIVGNDFNPNQSLDFEALVDRFQLLPSITDLDESYSIRLTGTNETPGEWLSNPVADLTLVSAISQAVEATAQALYTQIDSWDDPNTGYLRSATPDSPTDFLTSYLESLLNADSPATAFRIVVDTGSNLFVTLAPTAYSSDPNKLLGYLDGWDYARFARRIIQIDWDIYEATFNANVASRLWNSQNWLPTANALLRTDWSGITGFTDRGIVSIDPVHSLAQDSPYDLIVAYRARTTECTEPQKAQLCHDNCYDPVVISATDAVNEWQWAGTPRTDGYLPFLPKSIISGCETGRMSLAHGTEALWNEIGIFQNVEDVARWVNALEHGTSISQEGRIDLLQFLHHIYHSTVPQNQYQRYLAGMTSAILEYDNSRYNVDERTFIFLNNLLTSTDEHSEGYSTDPLGVDWETYELSLYNVRIRNAISNGAIRTFGSTEFNSKSIENRRILIEFKQQGDGWVEFYTITESDFPRLDYDPDIPSHTLAPFGVFLMTVNQFNYAQPLK